MRNFFSSVDVVVPQPRFPSALLEIPSVEQHLFFLKNTLGYCGVFKSQYGRLKINCPKYWTLPLSMIRKRMPIIAARSAIKMLDRAEKSFDLVHCHRIDYAYSGALLKRKQNIPLVITCHGSDVYEYPYLNDFNYSITQHVLRNANHVIAVGTSDAKGLIDLGLPRSKISIIHNGYDEQIFRPESQIQARRDLDLSLDLKIILNIASLLPVKGHYTLLKAIKILSKKRNDFRLILIGSGPLESTIHQTIKNMGLEEVVQMTGSISLTSIPKWISASDVVVLSSLNEGFPTVIPEAFSCGRPVVGTKVGSISDALSNRSVGLLVEPENHFNMSQSLEIALETEWDSAIIRKEAIKYSLESIGYQLKTLYEEVLS